MSALVREVGCHVGCHDRQIWRGWMRIEPSDGLDLTLAANRTQRTSGDGMSLRLPCHCEARAGYVPTLLSDP